MSTAKNINIKVTFVHIYCFINSIKAPGFTFYLLCTLEYINQSLQLDAIPEMRQKWGKY